MEWYFILMIIVFALIVVTFFGFLIKKDWDLRTRVREMVQNQVTKNANDFLNDYKQLAQKKNGSIKSFDTSGVYVIFNSSKQLYYVGQSKQVLQRVKSHLTGSGNGDVYADFKYGDNFDVTIHKCNEFNLNNIERTFISKYKSSGSNGYNKNRGNR